MKPKHAGDPSLPVIRRLGAPWRATVFKACCRTFLL